jgi:hypothetical protein
MALVAGALSFLVLPVLPRLARGEESRTVLGRLGGVVLATATGREQRAAQAVLEREEGGGGADVGSLSALQRRYLDSDCAPPGTCGGPCNIVSLLWIETTPNPGGASVFQDGVFLGRALEIDPELLPAINVVNIFLVPSGAHRYRVAGALGSTEEIVFNVLGAQPFADPVITACEPGPVAGNGTCAVRLSWTNADPPGEYTLSVDGRDRSPPLPGTATEVTVPGLAPGRHCVALTGSSGAYLGCEVGDCCDLACMAPPCNAPSSLLPCQVEYGAGAVNEVRLGWLNGKESYAEGVITYLDGAPAEVLENEGGRSPNEGMFSSLTPGTHTVGVRGDCGEMETALVERTVEVLTATPHTSPVAGALECEWSAVDGGTTTVRWSVDERSDFLELSVVTPGGLVPVGIFSGLVTEVFVTGTIPSDVVAVRFYVVAAGGCYASELLTCSPGPPSGARRFVRGLCDGHGDRPVISDAIFLFNFLFVGGSRPPCLTACNANGDGALDISDGSYILNFLFLGGPPPAGWVDRQPTCEEVAASPDCLSSHATCGT